MKESQETQEAVLDGDSGFKETKFWKRSKVNGHMETPGVSMPIIGSKGHEKVISGPGLQCESGVSLGYIVQNLILLIPPEIH